MDQTERLRELFDRYLRQDLPPAELDEMVSLLDRADAEDVLTEPMRRVWEELRNRQTEHAVDWERMFREVSQVGMDLSGLKSGAGGRWQPGRGLRHAQDGGAMARLGEVWAWRALAAVFLGLAGLAAYWSIAYRGPARGPAAANRGASAVGHEGVTSSGDTVLTWRTADNKKVAHLPDGSMVILNRHSRVDCKDRNVILSGEAYFDIVRRPGQPFLVHTGKIVTRVLGTAFDIRAYSTDRSIEVTVDHGKVQVLKGSSELGLLSDKEQMRVDRDTDVFRSLRVNLKPVMAWKPEEISFDDITMEEATKRIGERFNMNFVFARPALKQCHITATFYMEDDLDQIMEVICGVNQSTYVIRGSTVTIDGKGCN